MKDYKYRLLLLMVASLFILIFIKCNSTKSETKKIALISFITHPIFNTIENSFKNELKKQLGDKYQYELIENNAQGNLDNLPNLTSQILITNPDIIVPISTPVTQAVMRSAKPDLKIVYTFVSDTSNLGDALQRTNSTGLSDVINYKENIQLIRELYGDSVIIGIMYNANEANSVTGVKEINTIVNNSKTKVIYSTISNENEIAVASKSLITKVNVVLSIGDNTVGAGLKIIIDDAMQQKKPVFAIDEGSIKELGAIGGISVDYDKLGRETAKIVATILKEGKEPKNIPKIMLLGDKLLFNRVTLDKLNIHIPKDLETQAILVQ